MAGSARGKQVGLWSVIAVLGALLATASMAEARILPAEIEAYRDAVGASDERAREDLETQHRGVNVVQSLEEALGDEYAGVSFDDSIGAFVVPVLPGADRAEVAVEMGQMGIKNDYRVAFARSSWAELEAAQDQLDNALRPFIESGMARTSLDPEANAVMVDIAGDADQGEVKEIRRLAIHPGVSVRLSEGAQDRFQTGALGCTPQWIERYCGTPLRGGVGLNIHNDAVRECSVGFPARGNDGKPYILTAGHCAAFANSSVKHWDSADEFIDILHQSLSETLEHLHYIGELKQYSFPTHDWAKIEASEPYWNVSPWPTRVVKWGENQPTIINENYPIDGEASTYKGQIVCHSGVSSGTSCGVVAAVHVTETVVAHVAGLVYDLNQVLGGCAEGGDSGGPVFADSKALGLVSAGGAETKEGVYYPCHKAEWLYPNIKEATKDLGVGIYSRVDLVSTKTTIEATSLNGNPGWASVKGQVYSPEGVPIHEKQVEIRLFKWENGNWAEKATLKPTVYNGSYEYKNWNGVGAGTWIAKAVFPAQGNLGGSYSNEVTEGHFTVKDGYRIVSKKSGKCMDVHNAGKDNAEWIQQWDCLDPAVYQNQVFTLEPLGNGYYRLRARHSGRCLDVLQGKTSDGAPLQQWTCGNQENQQWLPIATGEGWEALQARHSSKCMDVTGMSQNNGAAIQQWSCSWQNHQRWAFKPVDSAPIPTETHVTVGETLYGESGYVSVDGYVKSGAYGVGGNQVEIFFKNLNTGTVKPVVKATLNSEGYYQHLYESVGRSNWQVWVKFPGAGNLAGSTSLVKDFYIGAGYRFIFRHSNKCMSLAKNTPPDENGVSIVQWGCSPAPNPNDGQVFTLVPRQPGYFNIEINKTKKCVDVLGASSSNGAWYQQWACGTPAAGHQLFNVMPMAGTEWKAFIAQHSGKCADVTGVSSADNARIQQWECYWSTNQQWRFEKIN